MSIEQRGISLPPMKRKKGRRLSRLGIGLLAILFLLFALCGYGLGRLFTDPLIPKTKIDGDKTAIISSDQVLNLLILGVDQRENEPSRADTIILASFNLKEKTIHLLSLPRDTRVAIPGKGVTRKINYAHAVGGAKLTVETVEQFLKIPVHYYMETNFEGFTRCIDILGGVTLNVEQRMYFPEENIDLQAGLQKLNGYDALSYVRWRSDGRGDIGRIERQQKFFNILSQQALKLSTLWKIPDIIRALSENVETDLALQKMVVLANKFRDVSTLQLEGHMVPGAPDDVHYGASYWIVDEKALEQLLKEIYDIEG